MKKHSRAIAATLIFTLSAAPAFAGRFVDVPETSSYNTAINYLSDVGVIQGYPDQTFHPYQNVNRVEFLKLVLESSNIETDINQPTPFPDIDEKAWYGKYVRKARSEGWIEGYPDGTFKPEQTINKVEALKIIGEVQEWDLSNKPEEPFADTDANQWFTPYVSYAKNKNFLEERTSRYFPELYLTRAQISELLFRAYITRMSESDTYSPTLANKYPPSTFVGVEPINPTEPDPQNFIAVPFTMTSADFFEGITLENSFPNIYYVNEVYYLNGTISSGTASQVFIFLAPEGSNNSNEYINYVADVENKKFSIPITFRKSGNFKMGLIKGNSGASKVVEISVLPSLPTIPSSAISKTPTNSKVEHINQQTTFSWNNNETEFIKLNVSQGTKEKIFYFRQGKEYFNIDYTDFTNFSETTTTFTVEGAMLTNEAPLSFETGWSDSISKSFKATKHQFSLIFTPYISINNFKDVLGTVQAIQLSGTTNADIFTEAVVIRPDGFVDLFNLTSTQPMQEYFGSSIIPKGNNFNFYYEPEGSGTYIIEINSTDGSAVVNTGIYVNNGIPLTPDYFDLNRFIQPADTLNLTQAREELFNLINSARQAAGLGTVTLKNNLNNLAQEHTDDMVKRDFFGHINPDEETPNDRRLRNGIPMPVGENLAISPTVLYTHNGLMQSGIHRNNILDPNWTQVGIGMSINQIGSLVTAQEFSSESYTETDLNTIENNILDVINQRRTNSGLSPLQIGSDVQLVAEEWSTKMVQQNFFDFTSPNGETLSQVVGEYAAGKPVQALILNSLSTNKLEQEAMSSSEVTDSKWMKIGIGVKNDSTGSLKTTVLFTTN